MAMGALACSSSVLPYRSRSARPRPISFRGILASVSCRTWLHPFFSQPPGGGAGGGGGGGRDAEEDAEAPVSSKGTNNQLGAERIHSSDSKNDHTEKLLPVLTTIQHTLASIDKSSKTMVSQIVHLNNRLTTMENLMATIRGPSTTPELTDAPANKDDAVMNRVKGFLGSMNSIADKLPTFCAAVLILLLTISSSATNSTTPNSSAPNSPTPNSPAPKAGHNFEDLRMQFLIMGSLTLYHISLYTLFLTSKFKDSKSIDGVLFKVNMWLLILVILCLSSEFYMIVHIFAHTHTYVILPLGIVLSILSVAWFWVLYKDHQEILELKKGCVPENSVSPENPASQAA